MGRLYPGSFRCAQTNPENTCVVLATGYLLCRTGMRKFFLLRLGMVTNY